MIKTTSLSPVTVRKALTFAIALLTLVASSCNKRDVEVTLYLKKNDASIVKIPDCEIKVISQNTLNKVLKLRQKLKKDYPFKLVSEEQVEKLKGEGYNGPLHPEEIDQVLPFISDLASRLGVDADTLLSEAAINDVMQAAASGSLQFELRTDWERTDSTTAGLIRIQQFNKASMPADKAANVGKEALKIIEEEALGSFKTNLEGKATIECPQDSFLWISCFVQGTFVSWIIPAADYTGNEAEINQSNAFIIERIPQSVSELHEDLATMKFFYTATSFGERNALPASLMSDDFYVAAKTALGSWNEEEWGLKFGN